MNGISHLKLTQRGSDAAEDPNIPLDPTSVNPTFERGHLSVYLEFLDLVV